MGRWHYILVRAHGALALYSSTQNLMLNDDDFVHVNVTIAFCQTKQVWFISWPGGIEDLEVA